MVTHFHIDRVYKILIIITLLITILYLGRIVLIPLAAASVLTILIYPLNSFFENFMHRILATMLNFLVLILFMAGVAYFFGTQILQLFGNIEHFWTQIESLIDNIITYFEVNIFNRQITLEDIGGSGRLLESSTFIVNKTITSSTILLGFLTMVAVYTFLFLLYRTSLKHFVLNYMFKSSDTFEIEDIINGIIAVIRKYFIGLLFVILIVGTLNGLGLWAIGLDYPFLFGYLAALLTIVPYIGTTIGGLLPTLYALINYESLWMPVMVAALYITVQSIEGNILTPKIVGSQASLNPLVAILSIIIGGVIWGIAGMILFVPFVAILKIIFDHVDQLKPVGILLSSDFVSQISAREKLKKNQTDHVNK